jgi:hypothetical protein
VDGDDPPPAGRELLDEVEAEEAGRAGDDGDPPGGAGVLRHAACS